VNGLFPENGFSESQTVDQHDKMTYYDAELDYDTVCFMKEQRHFQRYHNTPVEVDGRWFASVAQYEEYYCLKSAEEARLQQMTIRLKNLIADMVFSEKIKKIVASSEEFPPLPSKSK